MRIDRLPFRFLRIFVRAAGVFPALMVLMVLFVLAFGCGKRLPDEGLQKGVFNPVDTAFGTTELIIPSGQYRYTVIFREGDLVKADWKGEMGKAKGRHDFLAFLPIRNTASHGILWVNHETCHPDDILGDGGGATVMEVYRDSIKGWNVVGFPLAVNFGPVGGTIENCLGAVTPWGTILTSEEAEPMSNRELYPDSAGAMMRDTSDAGGWKKWKNLGWMVEVDPYQRVALAKHYSMGRFLHEGALVMPDRRTVYLIDDEGPGAFFKFVADTAARLSSGTLYACRLSEEGDCGDWLPLSQNRDSLLFARKLAFQAGATIFLRMEDIELHKDGTFFISETGSDSAYLAAAIALGGTVAPHLAKYHVGNQIYDDKYGRILRFDPKSGKITVFLEGGMGHDDQSIHLANPDNLALDRKRNLLYICEDLNGFSGGRVPANGPQKLINEIYALDLTIAQPKRDDLKRFAVIPAGAEPTGPVWSPDFSALFFNIQHPSKGNPAPFNKSLTVVVTGFPD